jgi:hypothetical protein
MVSFLEIFELLKNEHMRVKPLNAFYIKKLRMSRLNKARDWKPYGLSFTDPWYIWIDTVEIKMNIEKLHELQKKPSKEEVWHR